MFFGNSQAILEVYIIVQHKESSQRYYKRILDALQEISIQRNINAGLKNK